MGTLFLITLYAPDPLAAEAAAQAAFRRVAALDDIMSDYQADSELMRLCQQPAGSPVPVSAELFEVLEHAQRISELSNGAFDVTVGPYVRYWRKARKNRTLPTPAELASASAAVGYKKVRLDCSARTVTLLAPNMRLDLGGIAKGYAADQALHVLKSYGIPRALVAASGDIALGDPPPGQHGWKVGISPIDAVRPAGLDSATGSTTNIELGTASEAPRTFTLANAGISTSGDTEQAIEINGVRYSHIVNPETGLGLTNRIQVTIIAPDAITTDGLATAVSVLGVERGLALVDSQSKTAALILTKQDGHEQTFISRRFTKLAYPIQTVAPPSH